VKKKNTIGLISAVPFEAGRIRRLLKADGSRGRDRLTFYRGKIHGLNAVFVNSGIGKVNAAHAATLLITHYAPAVIINFGIGGAYPSSGLAKGDVAIATAEVNADEGILLKDGLLTYDTIGFPLVKRGRRSWFNEFSLPGTGHARTVSGLQRALGGISPLFQVVAGPFATVSACSGTAKRGREIEKRYGVICESMEGSAVAQICAINAMPLFEIRGISNIVEDRDREKWDIDAAAGNSQSVVMELVRALAEG